MTRHRLPASIAVVTAFLIVSLVSPPFAHAASLNPVQHIDAPAPFGSLAVSPDGNHVYATGSSSMFVFDRDAASGTLSLQTPLDYFDLGGIDGVAAAVSPDGGHVYVLSPADRLFVFDRNPMTGALSFVATYDDLADLPGDTRQPTGLALDASGTSLYVTANQPLGNQDCGAVGVFARNAGNGTLTKVETELLPDGVCPGADAVTVSPDGANVYVNANNAVLVYERDAGDGSLTLQQTSAVTLLRTFGTDVAVAPDGNHVYVATNDDGRVECNPTCITEAHDTFARNLAGNLTAVASTGKRELQLVAIDGIGGHVLFATRSNNRVLLYDRAMPTGLLTLSDVFETSADSTAEYPRSLVLSPDGRHAYFNIRRDITVLQLTCGDGVIDPGESCDDGNTSSGDGCSQRCQTESCWTCSGEPSSCSVAGDGTACDDGSACTLSDVCAAGVCAGSAEPDPGCRVPARGTITMKMDSRSNKLGWKWSGGSTLLADFGDPVETTDYTICVYDGSGRPQPIIELEPPRFCSNSRYSCWTRRSNEGGFEYEDPSRYPFRSLSLRAGSGEKAKLVVRAGTFGVAKDGQATLPLATPVTVQLKSSDGECWQSSHAAATVNSEVKFSAR